MRLQSTLQTICDLCDEQIVAGDPYQRAELVTAYQSRRPMSHPVKHWVLRWDPRSWPGGRGPSWEQSQANHERWDTRVYDMHAECLLRVVEAAMKAEVTL